MSSTANYLAIDIGASSGRAMLGAFAGARLALREVHRFANGPIKIGHGLHWDTTALFGEVRRSLALARRAVGTPPDGVGIDTWGVDYGLLTQAGDLIAAPHHYRDPRTLGLMDEAFRDVPRETLYARTGVQFMALNTLYQLLADLREPDRPLDRARALLFMPDLLSFWLTGQARSERTIASTSQLYDVGAGAWATDLAESLRIPARILPAVAPPGTILGPLLPDLARELGPTTVSSPASHDTASAVAAVPAPDVAGDWAYISSGTWCLVGRELRAPVRTPQALAANFTNECGVEGTIRFHKNITGLWLLQECQRVWSDRAQAPAIEELIDRANSAPPLAALIDPDHPSFTEFGDMPLRIREYCTRTSQPPPADDGALVRCILESLAVKSRLVIDTLEALTGPVRTIHLVGGGAQNALLCQFTADAAARPVLAGPIEATAAGNAMTQALAHRDVASLSQIRAVIARSFQPTHYQPRNAPLWADAADRMRALVGR